MRFFTRQTLSSLAISLIVAWPAFAADTTWTGAADNDVANAGNWSDGVPATFNDNAIIDGGDNLPIIIPDGIGTLQLGGFQLGTEGATGGHVIQNGGTLDVSADFKSHIGDQGTLDSSWIMNGNAVMLYDEPESGGGAGYGSDGDGQDLEIGAQTGAGGGVGRLELHDNAILRITDDLKIADEDNGDAEILIDGNAQVTVGSGISLSGGTMTPGILTVAGNGLLVSGNSAGPGLDATGYTNEGYLTMSPGPEGAELNLRDNSRTYVRTLQHRSQPASITIENSAELHIFEVFDNAEPNLGVATLGGDVGGSERATHVSQNADGVMTITVKDSGVLTVDSAPAGGFWTGFALSGGNNRGDAVGEGGTTTIDVSGSGRFEVQQDLHMTYGIGETAESTLKVTGPDATVNINGDLRMSIDDLAIANMGESYLHSVITGAGHSTINVGGTAFIGEGSLIVELDGYVPTGGESFTLLSATTIDGTAFRNMDFSLAGLQDGLTWDLGIDATSVTLNIMGSAGLACDFNGDGGCDIADLNAIYAGTDGAPALSNEAISTWLGQASAANNPAKGDSTHVYVIGDANLDGSVDSTDLGLLLNNFGSDSGKTWGDGNLNDDANIDSTDLGLLLNNFGAASSAAAVPEPTGANMAMLLLFALIPFLRRRS